MERIRRGDARAFEQIVNAYWNRLNLYAQGLTHDCDSAKDAVQEIFTRVWQGRTDWREHGSVRAYLFRAVRNRVIDWERQRRVWERLGARWREAQLWPRTPAEVLEQNELPAVLQRAIQSLPERRREVFVLAHFEDLTYQEIAEVMNLAPQTIANHVSLALRDLRRTLGPMFPRFATEMTATQIRQSRPS
ncbi:MAG: RNA polymerase sigma-70 factor [Longimicrobiales bacterium]